MEEAKGTSTKFVAWASRCFLLGVNLYGKGACMGTCTGDRRSWRRRVGEATRLLAYPHNDCLSMWEMESRII